MSDDGFDSPPCKGRGEWDGWIPDCPCWRCVEALEQVRSEIHRRPALRLIFGGRR